MHSARYEEVPARPPLPPRPLSPPRPSPPPGSWPGPDRPGSEMTDCLSESPVPRNPFLPPPTHTHIAAAAVAADRVHLLRRAALLPGARPPPRLPRSLRPPSRPRSRPAPACRRRIAWRVRLNFRCKPTQTSILGPPPPPAPRPGPTPARPALPRNSALPSATLYPPPTRPHPGLLFTGGSEGGAAGADALARRLGRGGGAGAGGYCAVHR